MLVEIRLKIAILSLIFIIRILLLKNITLKIKINKLRQKKIAIKTETSGLADAACSKYLMNLSYYNYIFPNLLKLDKVSTNLCPPKTSLCQFISHVQFNRYSVRNRLKYFITRTLMTKEDISQMISAFYLNMCNLIGSVVGLWLVFLHYCKYYN